MMYQGLIFDGFLKNVKENPRKVAVLDGERSLTYSELFERASQVSFSLRKAELESSKVVILGNKSLESIVGILGTVFSGCAYVALDVNQPASRFDIIFSSLQPGAVIFSEISPLLGFELKKMRAFPQLVLDLSGKVSRSIFPDSSRLSLESRSIYPKPFPREFIAYILCTSGSTGQPKGVCMSHGASSYALQMFQSHIGIRKEETIANQAALCFDLSVFDVFGSLNLGATLSLISSEKTSFPDRFFQALDSSKATSLFTTPSTLDFLLTNRIRFQDSSSFKRILLSGEPVTHSLLEKIKRFFCGDVELWNLYGSTEAPYILARHLATQDSEAINIFSLRGEKVELAIKNNVSCISSGKSIGELLVKSPALLSGYVDGNKEITSPLSDGGWYPTGDLASIDDNGHVTLYGRKDRQIKIKGHRVELDEIESQLIDCPEVSDAATVFIKQSEEIIAYITLCDGSLPQEKVLGEVELFCEKRLPSIYCPTKIIIVGCIPYTATGKKDRKSLSATESRRDSVLGQGLIKSI